MKNQYTSKPVKILSIEELNWNTKLFSLDIKWKFKPGQFVMAGLSGFGEAAFSLPSENQLAIRKTGALTSALHNLHAGENLWARGPYGQGTWPALVPQGGTAAGKPILAIAGGCGIISMKPLFESKNTIIFYGVKAKRDLLFKDEHKNWHSLFIAEEPTMVTDLFDKVDLPEKFTACLCGPPIMYKFVIERLKQKNIPDKNIYLSLERRMYCGVGICQHCATGKCYVCQNGPVFRLDKLKKQEF